ncbi:MFS transporter [Oscillatoria sp. CS-180]|uniref:MFS transporter n=1 Tax=Oscillatoria sp. CS-180 TaxID=3021720 RepID=UPI00232C016C|nr:MFS transporter [Oscillatoria sp. CS-180]MDB9529658.1 MFS transporter [Oscillatoria sp. CS-180]
MHVRNLRPSELNQVLILGFALCGNSLAQKIAEIESVSRFITDVGAPQFLLLMLVNSLISIVMTVTHTLLVDRFNRIKLLTATCFGLGLAFVLLRCLFILNAPPWLNNSLFYLLSEQQFTFFPLVFWVLATDLFEPRQAKRLFPLISALGLFGNLVGILIAAFSQDLLQRINSNSAELLIFNAFIYLILYMIFLFNLQDVQLRKTQTQTQSFKKTLMEGWDFVTSIPAFRYLTFSILAVVVCENIFDFHMLFTSASIFTDQNSYQKFFSAFVLIRVIGYLLFESVFTRLLINNFDLKNSFLLSPIAATGAALVAIASPGLWGSVGAVLMHNVPLYTVDKTSRRSFQSFVPEERRGRVSLFLDSYLTAAGAILTVLIVGGIILVSRVFGITDYFYIYLSLCLLVALIALFSILKMRAVYDSSLFHWRLKRRQRNKKIVDKLDL